MYLRCRECGKKYHSKDVRQKNILVYAAHQFLWHDCINGESIELDDKDMEVQGYDGCLGWP